jgi:hypothetical protein
LDELGKLGNRQIEELLRENMLVFLDVLSLDGVNGLSEQQNTCVEIHLSSLRVL